MKKISYIVSFDIRIMKFREIMAILVLGLAGLTSGAAGGESKARDVGALPDHGRAAAPAIRPFCADQTLAGYTLAWHDEFDGAALDPREWHYRAGNAFKSAHTPANVSLGGGMLRLAVKKENALGLAYTTGGVITNRLFKYGYYEARFKCPAAGGWHTSFWMSAAAHYQGPWLNAAGTPLGRKPEGLIQEIDVCEYEPRMNDRYSAGVMDWKTPSGRNQWTNYGLRMVPAVNPAADFHVFGCEFTPEKVRFFFDGKLTHETTVASFPHGEQCIWLTTVATGKPAMDDGALPDEALYDWVRYYAPPQSARKK